MLWCFEREKETLRLETRYDNDTSEFVAIIHYSDGREETKRFTQMDEFRSWLVAFERELEEQHWTSQGAPIFLPDGWPNERLM